MTNHHNNHPVVHHKKKWIDDRPTRIAFISGFFSTLITLLNTFLKK